MSMTKRTRANPKGLSRTISMASATKIGRGVHRDANSGWAMTAPITASNPKTWGNDVKDWSGIHVTLLSDQAAYAKVEAAYIRVRVWRFYNTHPMAMGDGRLQGGWIQGEDRIIPITGPAMTPQYSQHHVFDTRNSDKMYLQIVDTHVTGADPSDFGDLVEWLQIQLWGYTRKDEPIGVEISTGGEGVVPGASVLETLATHDLPVVAQGPQVMGEAKNFDGAVLPNTVDEGDAARFAITRSGVAYSFLTNEGGDETPIIGHDDSITAGKGGTVGVMNIVEAHPYDGIAMPVVGNEATRPKASTAGIAYAMLLNQYGTGTPVVTDGVAIVGQVTGLLTAGRAISVLPVAVDASDPVAFKTDLYGRLMLASHQLASDSDRAEEINPLDTRDDPSILADGDAVAAGVTVDFFMPMAHMKGFSLQWIPSDGNFTLKVYATNKDNGTALAACDYTDVTAAWFGAATFTTAQFLLFDEDMCAYGIHIEVVRGVGGGTHKAFGRRNY